MIALLLVAACGGGAGDATPLLPEAAEKATFATIASLGSYQLQASVTRTITAGGAPQTTQETVEVKWRDADHWSYRLGRDGRTRTEVVVWDAVAWSGGGEGPPVRKGDAEPYRVQLASVWDPWQWGLESLADSLAYQPGDAELVDGRRARHHNLALVPDDGKPNRGWTPTAVSGDVWIDEETAVRLKGKVLVDAVSGARTQRLELLFAVGSIGVDPGVSPPAGDKP